MVDIDTNFDRIRRGVWVGPNAAKPYVEWNDLSRVLTDLLQWARSPEVPTLLGIIMTGIKWRVLDNFAIFFPNHIFPSR